MSAPLNGKVAVVTGASRGIGRAVAVRLAALGCDVVVSGLTDERAEGTAEQVRLLGRKALVCLGDVSDPAHAKGLISVAEEELGRVDILVNSAGVARMVPFLELSAETLTRFLEVHLCATVYCAQEAARAMIRRGEGGRIINLSSIAASMGMYGTAAYAAAKGGVSAVTRVMAVELAGYGITVNAVAPGPVATEQLRAVYDEAMCRERSRSIPLARLAEPEEVAAVVAFLASPESAYLTGQVITLDGGASAVGCYSYETYKRHAPAG